MNHVNHAQKKYSQSYDKFGSTPEGICVPSSGESGNNFRYRKLLNIIDRELFDIKDQKIKILDVGCGYGSIIPILQKSFNDNFEYHGIDLLKGFIDDGNEKYKDSSNINFENTDLKSFIKNNNEIYDFVICNGIFTVVHGENRKEWISVLHEFIKDYFKIAKYGLSFNIFSTYCNYFDKDLFHYSPAELMTFIMQNVTYKTRIDHNYPNGFYEFSCFLYQEDSIINREKI